MTSEQFRALHPRKKPAADRLTAEQYQAQEVKPKRAKAVKWGETPKQSESEQQSECVNWFRAEYPQFAKLCFSVPNGGHRSKRTAAAIKREGAVAGIPDLAVCIPKGNYHGLFIEMKVRSNKPTPNQLEMMQLLSGQGYLCEVAYTTEEFKQIIQKYLNPA